MTAGVALAALLSLVGAEPLKVLVLDLRADSVPEGTARIVRDEIAVDMGRDDRLDVLSSEDLRRVVSVDAEKKALGCDETSCLAEVGQALGARYIIHGSVAVLGTTTIVHLNLVDTDQGKAIARETAESKSADELLPAVRAALGRIRMRMLGAPTPAAAVTEEPSAPLPMLAIVGGGVAGAGALVAIGGGVMMGVAYPTFTNTDAAVAERQGAQTLGQVGTGVLALGVVGIGVGGAVLVLGLME
jgi:TolB-like protein